MMYAILLLIKAPLRLQTPGFTLFRGCVKQYASLANIFACPSPAQWNTPV